MAVFDPDDFYQQLDDYLLDLNQSSPLRFNDPRRVIFNSYYGPMGSTNLQCQYNANCWADHLGLNRIIWHDDWTDGVNGPTIGNGIAITPRHILCTEHGAEVVNQNLVWAGRTSPYSNPADLTIINTVDVVYQVGREGWADGPNNKNLQAFRVLYTAEDVPTELVFTLLSPSELPDLSDATDGNIPVLMINRENKACIMEIISGFEAPKSNPVYPSGGWIQYRYPQLGPPASVGTVRSVLGTNPIVGDSGSPVFLIHQNLELVYLGATTGAQDRVASWGPSVYYCWDSIVGACMLLNTRNAATYSAPNYLPGKKIRTAYRPPPRPPF